MIRNIPTAIWASIAAGILRSAAGYIENVYKNGQNQQFEFKKLLGTIIQYFAYIMLLMLGLPAGQAVAGAFITDAIKLSLNNRRTTDQ